MDWTVPHSYVNHRLLECVWLWAFHLIAWENLWKWVICPSSVSDLDKLVVHKHGHFPNCWDVWEGQNQPQLICLPTLAKSAPSSGFFLPIFLWPFIKLMTAVVNHPYCDGPSKSASLVPPLSLEWAIWKICMDTHKKLLGHKLCAQWSASGRQS